MCTKFRNIALLYLYHNFNAETIVQKDYYKKILFEGSSGKRA